MLQTKEEGTAGSEEKKVKQDLADPLKEARESAADYFKSAFNPAEILTSFASIFSQLEGLATAFNKAMGGGEAYSQQIKQNLIGGKMAAEEYGFTLKDVATLQQGISEKEQTNFTLQSEQYEKFLVQAELTKGISETAVVAAQRNYETFKNLGLTVQSSLKGSEEIIQTSLKYGVSASAVFAKIKDNAADLNLFNFKDGVQGMAQMATESILFKTNMKGTLEMANKLFDPQQAMEMAAGLQRMGVQVTGMLDPISLMNMAENDPLELQRNIVEISKSFMEFDEKQQRFKIMPGAQRQIREVAATLGIPAKELETMGTSALDLERKLGQIKFPEASEFASEEARTMIANMAQFNSQSGKYEIEVYDKDLGQNVIKAVDDLKKDDLSGVETVQKNANKSTEDLLRDANGYLASISNEFKAGTARVPTALAASKFAQDKVKLAGGTAEPLVDAFMETLYGEDGTKGITGKFNLVSKQIDNMLESIIKGETTLADAGKSLTLALAEIGKQKIEDLKKLPENFGKKQAEAMQNNPELGTPFQITPDMLTALGNFVTALINGTAIQDGVISPSGGLVIMGEKGSYFADKDDSALISPTIPKPSGSIETEGSKSTAITAGGKIEIEHKFSGVEDWLKNYMLSQGFMADFVPTMEKFLTKTEG
jgi:hypothetical protein